MLSRESQVYWEMLHAEQGEPVNWEMLHAEQGEPGKLGDVTC